MGYLFKKMLRDIRSNWTQFLSVFLMAAISVLIFSGMASVWTGLNKSVDKLVADTEMADLWVRASGISDADLAEMKALAAVQDAVRCMRVSLPAGEDGSELEVNAVDSTRISRPLTITGGAFDADAQEGIWIDQSYAEKHGLNVGDPLTLTGYMGDVTLTVSGTVMSGEYIYYTGSITETVPNYADHGYAFVGRDTMLKLVPQLVYSQAKLKTDGSISDSAFREILGERFLCTQDRDSYTQFARSAQESQQMQKMATLFSAVFILLALLTMYTSMARLVSRQKTLIGTLKALGTSGAAIRLHYAAYGFVIPLAGGILGLIAGRFTVSRALMKVKQTTIYLPEWDLTHARASFLLIGLVMLSCIFAAVWAARSCLKGMPVEIMREHVSVPAAKAGAGDKESMSGIPYAWRWILRNILRNKIRFIMGIVGVAGGMVLMIAGMGVRDAINGSNDFVFSEQFRYNTKAILSTPGRTFAHGEDAQWIQESSIELRTGPGTVKQSALTVLEEGDMMRFFDDSDQEIPLPEEGAVLSRKLAKDLAVSEGDTIEFRLFGSEEWKSVTVGALSKTLSPQGLFMSDGAYQQQELTFVPTALLTVDEDADGLKKLEEVKSVVTLAHQIENTNKVADSVMSIVKLLILASLLLSIVILYNLGILNYVERMRDYATMKVLGFYQKEIRNIAIRECLLTTVTGWAAGLPLGILFLKLYVRIISFETFEWIPAVTPLTLVTASLIVIGVSVMVNLILSRKVKRIVMVEALKSVE